MPSQRSRFACELTFICIICIILYYSLWFVTGLSLLDVSDSHCYSQAEYDQMSLRTWVNVVCGKMTKIDRFSQQLTFPYYAVSKLDIKLAIPDTCKRPIIMWNAAAVLDGVHRWRCFWLPLHCLNVFNMLPRRADGRLFHEVSPWNVKLCIRHKNDCSHLWQFWFILYQFLSASLYFSKRGAYWDRLCRDVVGRWLSRACTVAKRCILGL